MKKYPKTPHLPFSEKTSSDDKVLVTDGHFYLMNEVIVTEKLDGENTSLYSNNVHARSVDSKNRYDSLNYAKNSWNKFKYLIPKDTCVVVENIYSNDNVRHSIVYNTSHSLSRLYIIAVRENDTYLSYDDMLLWSFILDIPTAPLLYRGKYNIKNIKACYTGISKLDNSSLQEGYIIRNSNEFNEEKFSNNIAKFVSKNFEISNTHWRL